MELAVRALTFFNVVALTWLGLTVLFNADRGKPGTWLTAAGLLIGSVCSVGHGVVRRPDRLGPAGCADRLVAPDLAAVRRCALPLVDRGHLVRGPPAKPLGSAGRPCAHPGGAGGLRPPAGAPGPRRPASDQPGRRGAYLLYAVTCIVAALAALHRPRGTGPLHGRACRPPRPALANGDVRRAQALSVAVGAGAGRSAARAAAAGRSARVGAGRPPGRADGPGDRLLRGVHRQAAAARRPRPALAPEPDPGGRAERNDGGEPGPCRSTRPSGLLLPTIVVARLLRPDHLAPARRARAQPGPLAAIHGQSPAWPRPLGEADDVDPSQPSATGPSSRSVPSARICSVRGSATSARSGRWRR